MDARRGRVHHVALPFALAVRASNGGGSVNVLDDKVMYPWERGSAVLGDYCPAAHLYISPYISVYLPFTVVS